MTHAFIPAAKVIDACEARLADIRAQFEDEAEEILQKMQRRSWWQRVVLRRPPLDRDEARKQFNDNLDPYSEARRCRGRAANASGPVQWLQKLAQAALLEDGPGAPIALSLEDFALLKDHL